MDEPLNWLCLGKERQTYPRMQWSGASASAFYFGLQSVPLSDVSLKLESTFVTPLQSDDTLIMPCSASSNEKSRFGIS